MRDIQDAKAMARTLREDLGRRGVDLTHSDCLEIVARQFGLADWNTLSAHLKARDREHLVLPPNWRRVGATPDLYDMGVDPMGSTSEATIRSKAGVPEPTATDADACFGAMMQTISAERYRLGKLRLAGQLWANGVNGSGSIFMRIHDARERLLSFDNLLGRSPERALSGDRGWTDREIVLEVPKSAATISFGLVLRGSGTIKLRHLVVEEAEPDAICTASSPSLPPTPTNLEFALN